MHEIAGIEVAKQPERQVSRRARMTGEGDTYLARLQHGWVVAESFKSFRRQVATFEQREGQILVQRRDRIRATRRDGGRGRMRGFRPPSPGQQ